MRSIRWFLALAAAWDVLVGVAFLRGAGRRETETRGGDTCANASGGPAAAPPSATAYRAFGLVVLAFAVLYAALAVRPNARLLAFSAAAKALGGASGAAGLLSGRWDVLTLLSLADAIWFPGFLVTRSRFRALSGASD